MKKNAVLILLISFCSFLLRSKEKPESLRLSKMLDLQGWHTLLNYWSKLPKIKNDLYAFFFTALKSESLMTYYRASCQSEILALQNENSIKLLGDPQLGRVYAHEMSLPLLNTSTY